MNENPKQIPEDTAGIPVTPVPERLAMPILEPY